MAETKIAVRWALILTLPLLAAGLQWLLWDPWVQPFAWLLFYPTAFLAAWLGGLPGGLAAGVIAALLGWFLFLPPRFSFALDNPSSLASIGTFVVMATLFGWIFERNERARGRAAKAINAAEIEQQKSRELRELLDERQRNRAMLSESEHRFVATFEQAAVGIALVAPDGRWLRVNRRLCDIVGYTPDELMTKTFQDITWPEDLEADLEQLHRMLRREISTYSMEKRYVRKDGRVAWINLTVSLVWSPEATPDYFISVVEDIDARKAAEAEVKVRTAELERFNQASVGRELQMIELKREINVLSRELGRAPRYDLSFAAEHTPGAKH